MHRSNYCIIASTASLLVLSSQWAMAVTSTPNIVWIISEDMGPDLGCWGTNVRTPNIDRLAEQGMRFTSLFGTASVCMPNRTAMITGVTQTTLGSVTMRPPKRFMRPLPEGVRPLPALLRDAGYLTANIRDKSLGASGKDDWNFQHSKKGWYTSELEDLRPHQPFYAQFNIQLAHRPYTRDHEHPVDPSKVDLPPYYPDHPVARRSWANYLESIQQLDRKVGGVLNWLEEQGIADNTIVFFFSDHGEAFLRGKYFLYDCSLNQPLIVRWPKSCNPPQQYKAGTTSDQLLASIDIAAQTLACVGKQPPDWMHGREFLSDQSKARDKIFSAADWIGGSRIKSRSVRTERYKYIRNFNTDLSVHSSSSEYRKAMHPLYHLVEVLNERDELSPKVRQILLDAFPEEELYDLDVDPHEMQNLAGNSANEKVRATLASQLETWITESDDLGFTALDPEHAAFFDAYKERQVKSLKKRQVAIRKKVEAAAR